MVANRSELDPVAMQTLIHHGKREGRVTRQDMITMLPDAEFDDDLFDHAKKQVTAAGIEYREEEDISQPVVEEFDELAQSLEEVAEDLPSGEDLLAGIEADNMVRMYFREATSTPLLNAEQEVELAKRVEACTHAQEELNRGVADEQHKAELEQVIERGRQARDRLIRSNARLVISVARRYRDYGLPLLDLIQEGNIGLMRAVRDYDYRRGFRFSTYATYWIRRYITGSLAEQSRVIRLPNYLSDRVNQLRREQQSLQQKLGRPPTTIELAAALGIPPDRVEQLRQVSLQPVSLEMPVGDEEESELGDVLPDTGAISPEETTIQDIDAADALRRLEMLPPRERQLIELRYGLTGEEPLSLAEIGQRMGVSRERARQLEVQALGRMRNMDVKRKRPEAASEPSQRPKVKK